MFGNQCNCCGYIGGHAPGCPEAPQPEPIGECFNCGNEIFAGDTIFHLETENGVKWLCCECCSGPYEAELPEWW